MTRHDQPASALAGPLPNSAFAPPPDHLPARHPFEGVLTVSGGELSTASEHLSGDFAMGGRPERFPDVDIALTTADGDLVPLERGFHRRGDPRSYWDIMAGPGRIWSEPGDGARSHAAFPFQLSNERENDSHHGLARFVWDGNRVEDLTVQVVTETLPDHLPEGFDLWGRLDASVSPGEQPGARAARSARLSERAAEHPMRPITDLADEVGDDLIAALFRGTGSDTEIVSGLAVDGELYTTGIRTRHGPYPYPRAMKPGLWSATKAAFGTTALMRLAVHLGPDVARTRIRDAVEIDADHDGWADVTIGDCLNMASGIGTAGTAGEPTDIFADNLTGPENAGAGPPEAASYRAYQDWYVARSCRDKLRAAFACPSYSWGPGRIARYRDQDLFMAGVAMDALWKRHAGDGADLFAMVADEVYRPAGIAWPAMNRTLEADGSTGVPLTAFGLHLGLDDVARLGCLLAGGGILDGTQVLEPSLVASCLDGSLDKGLATGTRTAEGGEVTYHLAYWQLPVTCRSGRTVRIPSMRGFGGQIIQPLQNGITCFRFAHDHPGTQERYDALKLPRIADALRPL